MRATDLQERSGAGHIDNPIIVDDDSSDDEPTTRPHYTHARGSASPHLDSSSHRASSLLSFDPMEDSEVVMVDSDGTSSPSSPASPLSSSSDDSDFEMLDPPPLSPVAGSISLFSRREARELNLLRRLGPGNQNRPIDLTDEADRASTTPLSVDLRDDDEECTDTEDEAERQAKREKAVQRILEEIECGIVFQDSVGSMFAMRA